MRTLTDFLRLNSRRYPDKTAVRDVAGGSRNYAELYERTMSAGGALAASGVMPGSTVGLMARNSVWAAEAYFAILAAGAMPVMYNWRWAEPELVFALGDSRASTVLVDQAHRAQVATVLESGQVDRNRRLIAEGPQYDQLVRTGGSAVPPRAMDSGNVIIYTGGTTGFPKGVVLSERTIITNALNEIIDTDMEHTDVTLLVAPMFHAASLLCWFAPHIVLGATSVLVDGFDEEVVGRTVEECRVTNGFLVPNMVRRLLAADAFRRFDWSSYRRMYVGGATFKLPDKLAVREVLPDTRIYYQYGLTEGGPIVTRLRPEDMFREEVDGSIGREFLFSEIDIRDLATQQPVAAGEVGELVVRGPNLMDGYFGRPEETAAVLLEGGWLRTGDLVSRDSDGYVYYHDRSKDMIKTGGENVYSVEVERVLYSHPAVMEAAVLGRESSEWDEEVCAVVAIKPGHTANSEELTKWCRASLAGYKVPKRFAFLEPGNIPVNDSGKLIKRALRQMCLFP